MSLSAKSFSLFKRDVFLFITNLMTGVVVARALGPSALGIWVILQMILGYAESFGRIKWDLAAVYFLGKKKHEMGDVVFTLNAAAVVTSALIIGFVVWKFEWLYGVLFARSQSDVRVFMYVILLQIPLQFLSQNYVYLHIFREDVRVYNRMVIIKSLCGSIVGIVLLLVFRLGIAAVVVSMLVSVGLALIYGVVKFGHVRKARRIVNLPLIKDLSAYGVMLYLTGIIGQLNAYVTRLIVVFYLPTAQVAYFAMAQNQGQLLNKVPDALNAFLYPRISKMDSGEDSAALAAHTFRVALVILTASACAAAFAIGPLVHLLYGRRFLAMVVPFRIMLPGVVLSGAATVLDQYFSGVGRADLSTKIAIVPLLAQVATALLLIPRFGLPGAAAAFSTTLMMLAVIQVLVFVRTSRRAARVRMVPQGSDVLVVARFAKSEVMKLAGRLGVIRRPVSQPDQAEIEEVEL